MSYKSQNAAHTRAEEVRLRMFNPKAWAIRLWENFGWHWSINCGTVCLHESHDGKYFFAMVNSEAGESGVGLSAWGEDRDLKHKQPQNAVNSAVRAAAAYVSELTEALNEARTACKGVPDAE